MSRRNGLAMEPQKLKLMDPSIPRVEHFVQERGTAQPIGALHHFHAQLLLITADPMIPHNDDKIRWGIFH